MSLKVDLPILRQCKKGTWFNVNFKGRCVYIGQHAQHNNVFIALLSDDLGAPHYKGGFIDLYPRKDDTVKSLIERNINL